MPQISSNPFTVQIQASKPRVSPLPAWVPPAGYFADVPMLNDPQDVLPAIYAGDSVAMSGPFDLWGGSAILRDYSALGAQVYYSGGHETGAGQANIQFTLICDFSTLTWSTANVPMQSNASGTFNANGYAPDGTPYCPHTYLGLQELPKAWGGGPKGSLVSFFWAGSTYENRINVMDVSQATMGYSQMATTQPQNANPTKIRFSASSQGGNYPITVMDTARQGWWAQVNGGADYLLFVSKNGAITQYPAMNGNLQDAAMILCDSLGLLVVLDGGYDSGGYAGTSYRKLQIRNLSTGVVTQTTTTGAVPALGTGYDGDDLNYHLPGMLGMQWVEELGCAVGLDTNASPPAVVKLTPPASNPATTPWAWSTVPLAHWPDNAGGQAQLQASKNATWSKWRWVPSLQAFVYGTAKNRKPQIIKLS
jgi:hypothetical protein